MPAEPTLLERLNNALPQTQCTRCGYPDCAAYAQAMAVGEAAINQCPPGGAEGVARLAAITGQPTVPLNPANGTEAPRGVAIIDEAWCIGCTLCIPVCPTDAIFGSNKMMHSVIEPYCTGCALCIPVCPVDCISLENVTGERTGWNAWSAQEADTARHRYDFHSYRRLLEKGQSTKTLTDSTKTGAEDAPGTALARTAADTPEARKRSVIDAVLARARTQRGQKP